MDNRGALEGRASDGSFRVGFASVGAYCDVDRINAANVVIRAYRNRPVLVVAVMLGIVAATLVPLEQKPDFVLNGE